MAFVKVFTIVIGIIIVISLIQFFLSIHPPRYVSSVTPSEYLLPYEEVTFATGDGLMLDGWLLQSPTANATIIVGHGYPFDKGNVLPIARFLYPTYNMLFYDHRYFGKSRGHLTTVGIRETKDVKAAVRFVQERFGDQPVGLYGFSLSAAAMLMSDVEVQAIVADSSYAHLRWMVEHVYRIFGPFKVPFVTITEFYAWMFFRIHVRDISPALALQEKNVPVLVIHGGRDSQIPVKHAYGLQQNNSRVRLYVVEDADHGEAYAMNPKAYEDEVFRLFRDYLSR